MPLTLNPQFWRFPTNPFFRLSTAMDGGTANDGSFDILLSANGRYAVFLSDATNLVAGDTNGMTDVFRKDLVTGELVRVSTTADGVQGNEDADSAQISADGRYVVFENDADNLVAGDTNGVYDIFRKDLVTGELVRVSCAQDGAQGNGNAYNAQISADGRYVVFENDADNLVAGDTNGVYDIFRKDLVTGEIVRVSSAMDGAQGNGPSGNAQLSVDGRYLVFESAATNLVAGDTNNAADIFRKDLVTSEIVRLSTTADGTQGDRDAVHAQISADGRYLVFESAATNLVAGDTNGQVDIFRKDLVTGEIVRVSTTIDGLQGNHSSNDAQISADGRYVVFESNADNLVAGDTNGQADIFRKDLVTGELVRLSTTLLAAQGKEEANADSTGGTITADGRYFVFQSGASNLVTGDTNSHTDIFRKDLVTGEIVRLSTAADGAQGNSNSIAAKISADGRYVVFQSGATNLVAGDTNNASDIFRKDLLTGELVLLSRAQDGTQANNGCGGGQLSADGRYVVFQSKASNLVTGDTNAYQDIFRKDLVTGELVRVSCAQDGTEANSLSSSAQISADGRYVVFQSFADNLVTGAVDSTEDIFRKDLVTGEVVLLSRAQDGTQANNSSTGAQLSADGRYVVFQSGATNLVAGDTNNASDIFRKDLLTGELVLLSRAQDGTQANNGCGGGQLSADGRYVVFQSDATNLVAGDTNGVGDVFRKDLVTGEVVRVSITAEGTQGNLSSNSAQISADGRYVVFQSDADNLVAGDTNNASDIFRKDLLTGELVRLSTTNRDAQGLQPANGASGMVRARLDGQVVVFESSAGNMTDGDTYNSDDVFIVDTSFDQQAMAEGRFVDMSFGVGQASSASIAWGDGETSTYTPSLGYAFFRHVYATTGAKNAVITVREGDQTWAVPYTIDLVNKAIARNTTLSDTLSGGSGADNLQGDNYANILIGNDGNDTYYVDNAGDRIIETATGGTADLVYSKLSLTLATYVEKLIGTGSGAITLTGNSLNNTITGNTAKNTLKGSSGNDTLNGGKGNDLLYGGTGSDKFVFNSALSSTSNKDKIIDWSSIYDTIQLENAVFTAFKKTGVLPKGAFVLGAKALQADDRVGYNPTTGDVWYDANGNKAGGYVAFTNIGKNKFINNADIVVI